MKFNKRIISLILVLNMLFGLSISANAARRNSIDANNGEVSGSFYRDEDDDRWYETWYSVSIPNDGILELSLLGDPELSMELLVYNEDKTEYVTYNSGRDKTIKVEAPLTEGDFYIKVYRNGGEGDYRLTSKFTAQPLSNDKENNNSFQYANKFNIDSTTTGHLGYYSNEGKDKTDWYEINIPVEGLLTLSFLGDPELSAEMTLYRNDGSDSIKYAYGRDEVLSILEPLLPGNYFVKIDCNDKFGGYTLKNTFQIFGKTNESEPNDSFQKAKAMTEDGVYVGTIGSYSNDTKERQDGKDWYSIYVQAGTYLRADLATEDTLGTNVNIYNVDGGSEMTYAYTNNGGSTRCYKKIENPGTYYICIDNPYGYGRYAIKATTSLTEPKEKSSLFVPDDPTAYKEVSIPTSTTVETVATVSKNQNSKYIILQVDNPLMNANGSPEAIDAGIGTTPIVYNGRTLVPIRAIVEKMGGTVGWDDATSSITLTYKGIVIKLVVDSTSATVNGAAKTLDVAPMVLNGRTLLPIRFITENFGGEVEWTESTSTITLKY